MPLRLEMHRTLLNPEILRGLPDISMMKIIFSVLIFAFGYPVSAMAYVGPGAGITALGALWAVILAILFALGGLLAWPIRAMLRRGKHPASQPKETTSDESTKTNTK